MGEREEGERERNSSLIICVRGLRSVPSVIMVWRVSLACSLARTSCVTSSINQKKATKRKREKEKETERERKEKKIDE